MIIKPWPETPLWHGPHVDRRLWERYGISARWDDWLQVFASIADGSAELVEAHASALFYLVPMRGRLVLLAVQPKPFFVATALPLRNLFHNIATGD